MKIYHFKQQQFLPVCIDEAWKFFSSPANLAKITPPGMTFRVEYISGDPSHIYPGQIIRYNLGIFRGFTTNWMTEITHVQKPHYFADEQRFGPYALWHHQHWFKEVVGGVEMTDEVNYAIPFGFLGRIANSVFVEKELRSIFKFRYETIEKLFAKKLKKINEFV